MNIARFDILPILVRTFVCYVPITWNATCSYRKSLVCDENINTILKHLRTYNIRELYLISLLFKKNPKPHVLLTEALKKECNWMSYFMT